MLIEIDWVIKNGMMTRYMPRKGEDVVEAECERITLSQQESAKLMKEITIKIKRIRDGTADVN